MAEKFETYKTAVVSTANMPEGLAKILDSGTDMPFIYESVEYGYRIWVPSDDIEDYYKDHWPEEIRPLMVQAFKEGCKWVNFDCDADIDYRFKVWKW